MKFYTLILTFLFCLHFVGCSFGVPSSEKSIQYFQANKNTFQSLTDKLLAVPFEDFTRISDTWTHPEDISPKYITQEELQTIRNQLQLLGIPSGVGINISSRSVQYPLKSSGISISGRSSGVLFSEEIPQNYASENLDWPQNPYNSYEEISFPKTGSYGFYISLGDNWYYFEEYDD